MLFIYAYYIAEKLQSKEDYINAKKGFVALIIENGNFDSRNALTTLSDIYITEKKGINVKRLIEEVYPLTSKEDFDEEYTFYETLKELEFHPVINERRKTCAVILGDHT